MDIYLILSFVSSVIQFYEYLYNINNVQSFQYNFMSSLVTQSGTLKEQFLSNTGFGSFFVGSFISSCNKKMYRMIHTGEENNKNLGPIYRCTSSSTSPFSTSAVLYFQTYCFLIILEAVSLRFTRYHRGLKTEILSSIYNVLLLAS